jgi:hypothetical protein
LTAAYQAHPDPATAYAWIGVYPIPNLSSEKSEWNLIPVPDQKDTYQIENVFNLKNTDQPRKLLTSSSDDTRIYIGIPPKNTDGSVRSGKDHLYINGDIKNIAETYWKFEPLKQGQNIYEIVNVISGAKLAVIADIPQLTATPRSPIAQWHLNLA